MKITLGSIVKDSVTGSEGVAMSYIVHKNACVRICIQPPLNDKEDIPNVVWVDRPDADLVGECVPPRVDMHVVPGDDSDEPGGSGRPTPSGYATP